MDLQARCEEAFRDYMVALQDAWTQPEIQEQGADAYGRYLSVVQEAWSPEVQQRVAGQWRQYEQVVQNALATAEMQSRALEAFRNYLMAIRNAWAETAPDAVDVAALTAVCQNMLTVAWLAGAAASSEAPPAPDFQQAMNPFQPSLR